MTEREGSSNHSNINPTERSLAEQLQINEREIQSRKDLLSFGEEDEKLLVALQPAAVEKLDQIVDVFYDRQLQFHEVALVIGDAETLHRLRQSMRFYILELFDGIYDVEYVNKRLRIGKIHQRIGVAPKLYVSAITVLQTVLTEFLLDETKNSKNCIVCDGQRVALQKILMFDMQLVFDTYISSLVTEVELAKTRLEEYAESLAERTEELREISTKDALTGLFNQRGFYEHLRRELAVAERHLEPLTLIYFDLNNFKKLNDSAGHKAGDKLLSLVGACVNSAIRAVDFGCRYGGDEFCIIMPRTNIDAAHLVFDRVIANFDNGETQGVTFSTGVACTGPTDFVHMDVLIKDADTLMYKAKAQARKKVGHHIQPLPKTKMPEGIGKAALE